MTYDTKCYDLARVFLSDCALPPAEFNDLADKLAQDIQRAIEDFIGEHDLDTRSRTSQSPTKGA